MTFKDLEPQSLVLTLAAVYIFVPISNILS